MQLGMLTVTYRNTEHGKVRPGTGRALGTAAGLIWQLLDT